MENTLEKEKAAEKAIKENRVWDYFFPDNTGVRKVVDKKHQKAGVDFIVYDKFGQEIYIDLKTGIGKNYGMHQEDYNTPVRTIKDYIPGIAIEIEQKNKYGSWWFTNTTSKMTDYMLYYIKDDITEYFLLVSYDEVSNISIEHKSKVEYVTIDGKEYYRNIWPGKYKVQTSFNGTGHYIKVPVNIFKSAKIWRTEQ